MEDKQWVHIYKFCVCCLTHQANLCITNLQPLSRNFGTLRVYLQALVYRPSVDSLLYMPYEMKDLNSFKKRFPVSVASSFLEINISVIFHICDRIWEKGPYRAFKKNELLLP